MAQPEVDGVISAETAACCPETLPTRAIADERRDLPHQVSIECVLAMQPVCRPNAAVVPGLLIDRVDTNELQIAGFNLVSNRIDYAAVLVFVEAAARSRKDHVRKASLPESQQFHVSMQGRARSEEHTSELQSRRDL